MDNDNLNNVETLLNEFKENRDALKEMIKNIEEYKEKIQILFPDKFDNKYKIFFEEKIKTMTSFFNSLLDIRKEINKSLKDEIELRRKMEQKEVDFESELDIRSIAEKMINLTNNKKQDKEYLNVQ